MLVGDLPIVAALLEIYLLGSRGRIPTVQEHGDAYRFCTEQSPKLGEVGFSYPVPIYAQQPPPSTKPSVVYPSFRSETLARSAGLIQNHFPKIQDVGSSHLQQHKRNFTGLDSFIEPRVTAPPFALPQS